MVQESCAKAIASASTRNPDICENIVQYILQVFEKTLEVRYTIDRLIFEKDVKINIMTNSFNFYGKKLHN